MLEVIFNQCTIAAGSRTILQNVCTHLTWPDSPGKVRAMGLMGPSGSGKTTLARAIIEAHYGSPRHDLCVKPASAVISYLPQTPVMFENLSVEQNARLLTTLGRYQKNFDENLFCELVTLLRLEDLVSRSVHVERISGGEAQRLMLLRTLSVRPDLLILDEPATGLDPTVREAFLIDLQTILARLDICVLYISHHWEEVSFLCSQVALAVTEWPQRPDAPIEALSVQRQADFAASPPTPDAFIAVFGPGCSALRLRGLPKTIAYLPSVHSNAGFVPRAGSERLSTGAARLLAQGAGLRAALYDSGRFTEWTTITNSMLMDPEP